MANSVFTSITIEGTTDIIEKLTMKLFDEEIEKADRSDQIDFMTIKLLKLLYKDYPVNEEYPTKEWMTKKTSSKWIFIQDWEFMQDYINLTIESADNTPEELFHELSDYLTSLNIGMYSMILNSEDESYLHVSGGFATYGTSKVISQEEFEIEYPKLDDKEYEDNPKLYDTKLETFFNYIEEIKTNLIDESRNYVVSQLDTLIKKLEKDELEKETSI